MTDADMRQIALQMALDRSPTGQNTAKEIMAMAATFYDFLRGTTPAVLGGMIPQNREAYDTIYDLTKTALQKHFAGIERRQKRKPTKAPRAKAKPRRKAKA